jgi:hypothetical protein
MVILFSVIMVHTQWIMAIKSILKIKLTFNSTEVQAALNGPSWVNKLVLDGRRLPL